MILGLVVSTMRNGYHYSKSKAIVPQITARNESNFGFMSEDYKEQNLNTHKGQQLTLLRHIKISRESQTHRQYH